MNKIVFLFLSMLMATTLYANEGELNNSENMEARPTQDRRVIESTEVREEDIVEPIHRLN